MEAFVTGTAGFIGFHLASRLLEAGHEVVGFDGFTDYYDPALKRARVTLVDRHPRFRQVEGRLEDAPSLDSAIRDAAPEAVFHLAAQAGVRYSLEHPQSYIQSNVVGTANLHEVLRRLPPRRLIFASTSSIYGGNTKTPFSETDRTDAPASLYAATKKSGEALVHSYAHLFGDRLDLCALLHGLRSLGPAGHGAVQVHRRHSQGKSHRRLRPGQHATRLHLCG